MVECLPMNGAMPEARLVHLSLSGGEADEAISITPDRDCFASLATTRDT
jgi:hypothetical protein